MPALVGTRRTLTSKPHHYSMRFDALATLINCGSDATLDMLHDAEMTVEAWINAEGYGEGNTGRIFSKYFYHLSVISTSGLDALISTIGADGRALTGLDDFTADSDWHHVVMYWNDAGDRKPYVAIDGVWVAAYASQVAGDDTITDEQSRSVCIGNVSTSATKTFDGRIGWVRISDNDRYSHETAFTPPSRHKPPNTDTNTVELWHVNEGQGATTFAQVKPSTNNGAITFGAGRWQRD